MTKLDDITASPHSHLILDSQPVELWQIRDQHKIKVVGQSNIYQGGSLVTGNRASTCHEIKILRTTRQTTVFDKEVCYVKNRPIQHLSVRYGFNELEGEDSGFEVSHMT